MDKNVVVTGANRGIGLALVNQYLSRGFSVYGVCRTASEALENSGAMVISGIDVQSEANINLLCDKLSSIDIHILINNAGILENNSLCTIDYSSVEKQLLVNALAPLRVTEALLDCCIKGTKIGFITSRMGSIADNGSGGYYGYRMSKAALNAAAMSLAKDLLPKGIMVAILHPGFVQTDMVGHAGDVTADQSAQGLVSRLENLSEQNTGTFWHANGEQLPW